MTPLDRLPAVLLLSLSCAVAAACATSEAPTAPASAPAVPPGAPRPEWRPGDRWVYDWTSGNDRGTKTVEMMALTTVNTVEYYVVRVGELDHYYTRDLEWAAAVREAKVEARMSPPQPYFAWPLGVGRQWRHRAVFENRDGKRDYNATFVVTAAEAVEVPAGRFSALKIVREGDARDFDEYWYAPEVGYYAKWRGRRDGVEFEEVLREHEAAPRPGTPSAPSPPSPPR
jgi:hypothetical protein